MLPPSFLPQPGISGFDRSSSSLPTATLIAPGNLHLLAWSILDVSLLPDSCLPAIVRNTSKPGLSALSNTAEQRGKKELNQFLYSLLHEALFLVVWGFFNPCGFVLLIES